MNDAHFAISRHGNSFKRCKHSLWNETGACVNMYMWTSDWPETSHNLKSMLVIPPISLYFIIFLHHCTEIHDQPRSTEICQYWFHLVAFVSNYVALECSWLHLFALGCTLFHFTVFGWYCLQFVLLGCSLLRLDALCCALFAFCCFWFHLVVLGCTLV